ncbi:DsbA family protein [Ferrovibrio sp.]|uniref:DsbA family protein n=1 Tax=Ferrovibrio sp. TaxID=1917215 RepID=UPI00260B16A4|nr:DsbA family protein [Ferrovibrio sp.]
MAQFTYLFDPLCGWCYGAGATLHWLRGQPGVALRGLPTGLFAWERAIPLERMRDHIRQADERIGRLSGQDFSAAYVEQVVMQPGGMVDSGPATLALSIIERRQPGRGLDLLRDIQQARYGDGRDVTDPAVLADLVVAHGLDAAAFIAAYADPEEQRQARLWAGQGQLLLDAVGARGVPTLLLHGAASVPPRVMPSDVLYHDRDRLQLLLQAA